MKVTTRTATVTAAALLFAVLCSGCASIVTTTDGFGTYEIPKGQMALTETPVDANGVVYPDANRPPAEMAKVSLPDYVIEPPDILLIEGIHIVPKTPYEIHSQDVLQIVVMNLTQENPINGLYLVESDGAVRLGPSYGMVHVEGLSLDEAENAIREALMKQVSNPLVSVNMNQASWQRTVIAGEHLVALDGTVNLGSFGRVYVTGMTLDQGRAAIEKHLSKFFEEPKVSLDVYVYNSKYYYVIVEGGGIGDQVARIPITGSETVLDAISQMGGLGQASSKKIWISRPAPNGMACDQILPVDWEAITRGAATATNWQLMPGDRLFVAENSLVAWSNLASIFLNPFERVIGFSLLGAQTVQTLQRFPEGFQQR